MLAGSMKHGVYIKRTEINAPVERVFDWHAQDGAIARLTPPWAPLKLISRSGSGIEKGVTVVFKISLFKLPMRWEAVHIDYQHHDYFKDRQIKGPFGRWEHTHRFIPSGQNATIMEDRIDFRLPFGVLSRPFYGLAQKELDRMFRYRHRVLKHDMESPIQNSTPKRILISGASGTIGSSLVPFLKTCGHHVICLVRKEGPLRPHELFWDPDKGILDLKSVEPIDAVINLNGRDISRGCWTPKQKKRIISSRVCPTRLLSEKMAALDHKPEVFLSSSAIGYYGEGQDTVLTEKSGEGDCFISNVCRRWEDASQAARDAGIRTLTLRIGIVLSPAGGALARMQLPFSLGCGVRLAKGRQYMSWISMDDFLSALLFLIETPSINGPVNLTAPEPVTNAVFSNTLAAVFSKKVLLSMPASLVHLIWGQMGHETLLTSARVLPSKLIQAGFNFQHKSLKPALKDLLGKS